jgi:hypothetical protein
MLREGDAAAALGLLEEARLLAVVLPEVAELRGCVPCRSSAPLATPSLTPSSCCRRSTGARLVS